MTDLHWTTGIGRDRGEAASVAASRWLIRGPGRVLEIVETWRERDRLRRELAALPDQMLKDIGLTRGQVLYETDKPFWRPLDRAWLELRRQENTAVTAPETAG